MSFENKGSMSVVVTVTMHPDRSGNFVIETGADPAVTIEAAWAYLNTFGGGTLVTKGAGQTWTFQTQVNSQGSYVTWISDWSLTFTCINGLNDHLIYIVNHQGIHLKRLKIDGNSANQTAGAGVRIDGGANARDFIFEQLYIEDCKTQGINCFFVYDGDVLNCITNSNLSHGINLNTCRRVSVVNHLAENNGIYGIVLSNACQHCHVINPECTGHTDENDAGIMFDQVRGYWNYVEGGRTYNNWFGLHTWHSQFISLDRLSATDNLHCGIRLDTDLDADNPGGHKVADCIGDTNGAGSADVFGRSGLVLDDVADVTITGGFYRGNSRNGIAIECSARIIHDILVQGVYCSNNTIDGIRCYSNEDAYPNTKGHIIGGEFVDNGQYGINLEMRVDNWTVQGVLTENNTTGCANIGNANCDNNRFRDNTFNDLGFTDSGTNTILPSKPFQFIKELNGSYETTSPTGILIDAATEAAILQGHIPNDAQQIVRLRIFAVAKGGPIAAGGQMHLEITFNAGSPNAAYNTAATSWNVVNKDGEEADYVADDVVTWICTDADTGDSELSALIAGDKFELIVLHETGADPDGATNAVFGSIALEYV